MIPELGHLAMILALCLTLVQASLPLIGAWRGDRQWMSLAVPAAWGQFAFLVFAFLCLTYAFTVTSARPAISISLWPTPTVSMMMWS